MSDVELKAQKAAVDFVNSHFTDIESLDRVKDVFDDVYKMHETCRQQLDEQVVTGLRTMINYSYHGPVGRLFIPWTVRTILFM